MAKLILGIDPGCVYSAFCFVDEQYTPVQFGKILNTNFKDQVRTNVFNSSCAGIENIIPFGGKVGKEITDTCRWIGRFQEWLTGYCFEEKYVELVARKTIVTHLTGKSQGGDKQVRAALIDRFGNVGTKKAPCFFYGFSNDVWSAFAVATYILDKRKEDELC